MVSFMTAVVFIVSGKYVIIMTIKDKNQRLIDRIFEKIKFL